MAQSIDKLEVQVEATASGASQVVSSLVTQLQNLQSALNGLDTSKLKQMTKTSNKVGIDTSGMTNAEKEVSNSIDSLKQKLVGLNSYKNAALNGDSSSLTSFNRRVISIQSEVDVLGEKLRQLSDSRTGINIDTDTFQTYRSQLADIQSELTSTSETVKTTASNMSKTKFNIDASDVHSALTTIIDKTKETASQLWSLTKNTFKSGFSSLKNSLTGIKDSLTGIGKNSSGVVSTGFSKILKYGFGIRSLYVLFRRLRTAIKDSFTELQNSGAYYQTTKANVEALKNSLTTLKYQFGAAFEPIFNTVAPALQTLINYLVAVMNTISAFIAKLTGKSTYSKAVAATAEIASNTGSAAGSAAELNKQLQGFDELNNLDLDSGSSGGSGGGSSSDSSGVTYVEENVENALGDFTNTLIDKIKSGDWEGVGSTISSKLTSLLKKINWNTIFEGASNFGTNLAEFLKGLISDDLFSELGKTIANSIKTALIAALSFSNTMTNNNTWAELGSAIASGINAFVKENPLKLVVANFNSWANGILTTLISAVDGISWSTIAQHIADAIGEIDASTILWNLGSLVSSLANALYTLVSNKETWTNLGTKIGEGITSFFNSMNETNASTGLTGWQALGKSLESIATGIADTLTTALTTADWQSVGQGIADFVSSIDWKKIKWSLGKLKDAFRDAFVELIKGMNITAEDLADVTISVAGVALLIGAITAVKLAADITKTVVMKMIETKILAMLGANSAAATGGAQAAAAAGSSLGTVATVACEIALIVGVVIAGWQIGGNLYESATGNYGASQGIIDTVKDAWDGLVSENKIEFSFLDFFDFTVDDVNSGTGWLKNTDLWKNLTTFRDSIKTAWNQLTGQSTVSHGYNGATSEAVKYIESTGQGYTTDSEVDNYFSELGSNVINGVISGMTLALKSNPVTYVAGILFDKTVNAIKTVFGIESPAKNMYDYGKYIFQGIIEGFIQEMNNYGWDDLAEDLKNLFTGTTTTKTGNTAQGNFNRNSDKVHGGKNGNTVTYKINTETQINGSKKSKTEINEYATAYDDLFKNASQSASATYSAETGGQLKTIDDVTDWKTKFHNLYQQWMGRDAQFTSSEDGIANGKISGWIVKLGELAKEWLGKSTSATFSTKESGLSSFYTEKTGYLARLQNLNTAWEGKGQNRTATFTTNLGGNLSSASDLNTAATAISTLNNSFTGNKSASYSVSLSGSSAKDMADYAGGVAALDSSFSSASSKDLDYNVKLSGNYSGVEELVNTIVSKISSKLSKYQLKFTSNALGGIIANGTKYNIPQYAGGTLNAGSVFVAGENGPEVMGHINGRTEILNRSQIASIMNNSFVSAMAQFGNRMLTSPETIAYKTGTYQTYSGSDSNGNNMYVAEQNELLRQQNELLMQILEKPTGISSRDIFNATRSEASSYYNRTGNSPFI